MDKSDALSQLKDIHLPDPVGWWPLAPGWYLLIALLILLSAYSASALYRRYQHQRAKKQALRLLAEYAKQYQLDNNSQRSSAQLSELLRRVALAYYPRATVASLKGEEWIAFLNKHAKQVDFTPVKNMLLDLPFQAKQDISLKPLFKRVEDWIKQQGGPCLS